MSNQLRLLIFIVVISGALCTVQDYVIMSQCAHNKAIYLAPEGKVSVTDIPMAQNITIAGTTDFLSTQVFKITLYAKETKMYLCFNTHWKLVGMKKIQETCYFNESIVHGYFEYRSAVDPNRRVGFTHRGKAIGPKKNVTDACYFFTKIEADRFFHQYTDSFKQHQHNQFHTTPLPSITSNSPQRLLPSKSTGKPSSSSTLTPSKTSNLVEGGKATSEASRQTTRRKSQRGKQGKESIPGGTGSARSRGSATVSRQPNGHNSNLSNNSTSNNRRGNNNLSSTNINHRNHHSHNNSHNGNVQQTPVSQIHNLRKHPQSSQHHQVRHHHNNPNFIARRKQYQRDQKRRRLRNNQQQFTNNMQRLKSEVPLSSPVSPVLSMLPSIPLSVSSSSQLGGLAPLTPSSPGEYNFSLMPARRKARRKKDRMESRKLLGDSNNRRASKEQPEMFITPSTSQRITTKDNLPSSVVSLLSLSSLSTKTDVITPSMPTLGLAPSSSTDTTPITFISPTPTDELSLSNASVMSLFDMASSSSIDPSPSTQFESLAPSTSINTWSTTTLDDISSSSILSFSSFDEVSPTSQSTNDVLLVMESVGKERTDGTSTSIDDNTSSSFSTDSSLDDSYRSSTINYRNDEYSNDDTSARPVLPNHLNNSVTEYQYSTSDSRYVNNSKLKKYYHNGSIGIEKKIEIKSIPIPNVSGIGTLTTIAATNHRNSNIGSYLNINNTNSQNYSKTSTERWFLTQNPSTNSSKFYDSAFNSNTNQISNKNNTISITTNRTIYNNNLLKSEVKKNYNKKTTTIATTTTHDPQVSPTSVTTKVPTKHTSTASYKPNNLNSFYSGEFIDAAGAYDIMPDDELIIGETSAGSGGRLLVVGYLPTTASLSSLPESIRIAKIKVNKERRKQLRRKLPVGSK